MQKRTIPCLIAAGFLGVTLTLGASALAAQPPEVVVKGKKIDPTLQRVVSYNDLNLTDRSDRNVLNRRIRVTADNLCFDINGFDSQDCTWLAVRSTDDQVAAAVARAHQKMAGLPVGPAVQISMVIGH
jgi:UrcA family protein